VDDDDIAAHGQRLRQHDDARCRCGDERPFRRATVLPGAKVADVGDGTGAPRAKGAGRRVVRVDRALERLLPEDAGRDLRPGLYHALALGNHHVGREYRRLVLGNDDLLVVVGAGGYLDRPCTLYEVAARRDVAEVE